MTRTQTPDELEERDAAPARFGLLGTASVAFFLDQMGDKTQVATVPLTVQCHAFSSVFAGPTLDTMIASVPAVLPGDRIADRMPARLARGIDAAIFALLGPAALPGAGERIGF